MLLEARSVEARWHVPRLNLLNIKEAFSTCWNDMNRYAIFLQKDLTKNNSVIILSV